jgi:hypothetical protein
MGAPFCIFANFTTKKSPLKGMNKKSRFYPWAYSIVITGYLYYRVLGGEILGILGGEVQLL